ncbi:MAG: right-handed parallel beta-helix repeat-containing protein, partial [Terriglobia bacterium]
MISPTNNSALKPGDVIYVRGGKYVEEDDEDMLIHFRGGSGLSSQPFAVAGFPGESAILDLGQTSRGAFYPETNSLDHWVISKLHFVNGGAAIGLKGTDLRVIGCTFSKMNREAWTGMIMVDTSQDVKILGNFFDHCGYDMYLHQIYIKTHDAAGFGTRQQAERVDVGWNEFDSWTSDLNPAAQTKPSRGGAIEIQTESTAYRKGKLTNQIQIHDNYFHDGDSHALYIAESKDLVVFNNIFSKIQSRNGGVHLAMGDERREILFLNNTFYLSAASSGPLFYVMSQSAARLENNILVGAQGQPFVRLDGQVGFRSDHDLYTGGQMPGGERVDVRNPVQGDPQFRRPGRDYRLLPSSPAIDSGTAEVERWVKSDVDGVRRPLGKGFDIGAYESQ